MEEEGVGGSGRKKKGREAGRERRKEGRRVEKKGGWEGSREGGKKEVREEEGSRGEKRRKRLLSSHRMAV